jgi:hypothetical protein
MRILFWASTKDQESNVTQFDASNPATNTIHTGGGAYIGESANPGGDFITGDQINITIQQETPPVARAKLETSDLLLLNFTRPLTPAQRAQIETALGYRIGRELERMVHFDDMVDFAQQCIALLDEMRLSTHEWQTLPILVNPPGLSPGALCLISELHGRMGHFPALVRLRPRPNSATAIYDVAELINLQAVRDAARRRPL